MTSNALKYLAGLTAILVVAFLILDYGSNSPSASDTLFPDLKSKINDVTSLVARNGDGPVNVRKSDDGWVVAERSDYTANIGTLRELLLAIADAKIIERKTSDPEKYHLIGVNDPSDDGSESVAISISGDGFEYTVVLGATAQTNYRYVRPGTDPQSVLIDKNPNIPGDASGWLADELVDVSTERVQQVIISHADGEEVVVEKQSADAGFFELTNIPAGRELSYSTVTNGIGAALADLKLDDVRPAPQQQSTPVTTTTFQTFNGLRVTAREYRDGDAVWISFVADTTDVAEEEVQAEAEKINQRLDGWQYAIPEYKANMLTRHFDDLLKAVE
jgi:uncharacterized protein DUF4340